MLVCAYSTISDSIAQVFEHCLGCAYIFYTVQVGNIVRP